MAENGYSGHLMHYVEGASRDGASASAVGSFSPTRFEDLPYEHTGAGARLAHPPGLHGIIVDGGRVLLNHVARKRGWYCFLEP